ncbi:Hypothetical predicted protein [Mytilus galloprovincialis]|uniref:Peptidase S1 domain-containing protein n=2 Tax=Mytilus galloprovincialis TaxID=29158 RepID=A0A8B6DA29_MYTGA|nr:Hypothetical predicted protein [Mytilus galloprovincialis]
MHRNVLCGFTVIFMAAVTRAAVTKIVNGENADITDCPWQISLQRNENGADWVHVCGGTIINERWILSVAHCFENHLTASNYRVAAGSSFLSQMTVFRSVKQIVVHEDYKKPLENDNDLMLLELATPLTFGSTINKITLDDSQSNDFVGDDCKVSGWGNTDKVGGDSYPDRLQVAHLAVVSQEYCSTFYLPPHHIINIDSKKICLHENGTDVCDGDSGGPMSCKATDGNTKLVGLTSFGPDNCDGSDPGVYTKVSAFLDWISNKMIMIPEKKDDPVDTKDEQNKKNKKNRKNKKKRKNKKNKHNKKGKKNKRN